MSKMLSQHQDIIKVPYETQAYPYIYNTFEYAQKLSFPQRIRNIKRLIKCYKLNSIIFGFKSSDLWHGILRQYQQPQYGGRGLHHLVSEQDIKNMVQMIREQPEEDLVKARKLIVEIFELGFLNLGGKPNQILLEKTPRHIYYIDLILADFPEAKVIEIIRDGRDVCASFQSYAKTQKWTRQSTAEIISIWQSSIKSGEKFRNDSSVSDRFTSVRYESLKQNTNAELTRLFDYIGLDHNSEMVDSIIDSCDIRNVKNRGEGKHINKGIVGRWRESLSENDIALWEHVAHEDLEQLGY